MIVPSFFFFAVYPSRLMSTVAVRRIEALHLDQIVSIIVANSVSHSERNMINVCHTSVVHI